MNMICCHVIGNDTAIAYASQEGQLELNVMMPVINYNLLQSILIMTNGLRMLRIKCVDGITVNKDRAGHYAESTVGVATILNPVIGYEKAAEVAKESVRTGKSIKDIVLQQRLITESEWNMLVQE
jgi:aspartate ammonia-lyase